MLLHDQLAEALLRCGSSEAVRRLSALLMVADQPFFIADLAMATSVWSRSTELHLGHDPRALAGLPGTWRSFVHPEDQERVGRRAAEILCGDADVYTDRLRVARADGTYAPVLVRASIIRENGRAVAAIGGLTLEADTVRHEEALHLVDELRLGRSTDADFEQRRLELVAETVDDAVYEWDPATGSVHLGPGMQSLFGYEARAVERGDAWWLERVHPDDRPGVECSLQAFLRGGTEDRWVAGYRFRQADGRYVTVRDRARALRDRAGALIRVIGAMVIAPEETTAPRRRTIRVTPRQADVLDLVRTGSTSKEIARVLGISERSVKEHLSHLLRLFGAPNRAALVAAAAASDIVRDPSALPRLSR